MSSLSRATESARVSHISMGVSRPNEDLFSFAQPQRMGRAFGVSAVVHVALFLSAIFVARYAPVSDALTYAEKAHKQIIWLAVPGAGGGGGGGGNKSVDPPRKAELPGKDQITVPVASTPKPTPEPKDKPIEDQQLTIPAMTLAAGEQMVPGMIEGLPNTTSQGSGEGGGAGTGTGTGMGPGEGSGLGPGSGGGTGGGAYRPGNGVLPPRVLREVKPQYTAEAMRAKVQGSVWLQAVVLQDGSVGEVRVVRSLDPTFGLDQEAIKAARQWRFIPGTRFGETVPVLVVIELTFNLR